MSIFDDDEDFDDIKDFNESNSQENSDDSDSDWKTGCMLLVGIAIVIFACLMFSWSSFVGFGIGTDFVEYKGYVRESAVDRETKTYLLDRLEYTAAHLRDNDKEPGFWRWISIDSEIQDAISDSEITEQDIDTVERLLDRLDAR